MAEKDGEKISMTADELSALVDERVKNAVADSKMGDDEKKLRKLVREETSRTMTEKLSEFFKFDDGEEEEEGSGGENDGGETGGFFDNLLKVFSSNNG